MSPPADGNEDEAAADEDAAGAPQSEADLMAMRKDDLLAHAESLGVEVDDSQTKQQITDAVLEHLAVVGDGEAAEDMADADAEALDELGSGGAADGATSAGDAHAATSGVSEASDEDTDEEQLEELAEWHPDEALVTEDELEEAAAEAESAAEAAAEAAAAKEALGHQVAWEGDDEAESGSDESSSTSADDPDADASPADSDDAADVAADDADDGDADSDGDSDASDGDADADDSSDDAPSGDTSSSDTGDSGNAVPADGESDPLTDDIGDGMLLGTDRRDGAPVRVPLSILARHAAMLGSTGSGKTVMAKTVLEEATINEVPTLIIDPQGDLARLVLGVDEDTLVDKGGSLARRQAYLDKAEVRIWTPLRSKGLPICIDPFAAPPAGLDLEEAIIAWDMVAAGFASLAGFGEGGNAAEVRAYLYEIWTHATRLGLEMPDFKTLSKVVRDPHQAFTNHLHPEPEDHEILVTSTEDEEGEQGPDTETWSAPEWEAMMDEHDLPNLEEMLTKGTRDTLGRKLSAFSSGVNQLLFSNGTPLDIDTFIAPIEEGKVPVNIVYMNTIQDDSLKQYFLQEIARTLYDWMLTQQTSDGELNLVFFMDEVAPYLPSDPRNPPAKELVKLIFKQARKYGVSAILATQNVVDVDYKILAQANTTFIGRFSQPQDIKKVSHLLKESGGELDLIDELPNLGPGQFQLVAPDVDPNPIPLQCRWLYTDHGAPFTEDDVEEHTSDTAREWSAARGATRQHKGAAIVGGATPAGGAPAKAAAAKAAGLSGMAAAAAGVVDDGEGFEVRLMGGLNVLKDGRDPLYVMQGITNLLTTIVVAWAAIEMMMLWNDDKLAGWWATVGVLLAAIVVGLIGIEHFGGHDAEWQRKITRFARLIQYGIAGWLVALASWQAWGDLAFSSWLDTALEINVTWVVVFIVVEFWHRLNLGSVGDGKVVEGTSVVGKMAQGIKNLSAVITTSELQAMQTSSREVLRFVRIISDAAVLLFFVATTVIVIVADEGTSITEAMPGGETTVLNIILWLGSFIALRFVAEASLWLRGADA